MSGGQGDCREVGDTVQGQGDCGEVRETEGRLVGLQGGQGNWGGQGDCVKVGETVDRSGRL